jgi:DNA-binding transcriptional regulator YiaG
MAPKKDKAVRWDGREVRALRKHLGMSQDELAGELGTRQQTISEWETGKYRPRGTSSRLLGLVAERSGFTYRTGGRQP